MPEVTEAQEEETVDGHASEETDNEDEEESTEEETEDEPTDGEPDEEPEEDEEEEEEYLVLDSGVKVSVDELKKGYMRDSDYRKKTMSIAEERKALEQQASGKKPGGEDDYLSKYPQKELKEFKKLAKALGFVSMDEFRNEQSKSQKTNIVNDFFKSHPEYNEKNDPTGIKYNLLRQELSYYNLDDLDKLPNVMERAHKSVETHLDKPGKKAKELAKKERSKSATVGSGGSGSSETPQTKKTKYTPEQIKVMKQMGVYEDN